jgi:hypothetical protein
LITVSSLIFLLSSCITTLLHRMWCIKYRIGCHYCILGIVFGWNLDGRGVLPHLYVCPWPKIPWFSIAVSNFYLCTLEEFYTGTLYLGYFSGPVEGIVVLIGVYLVSAVFGSQIWLKPAQSVVPFLSELKFIPKMPMNEFFIYSTGVIVVAILISVFVPWICHLMLILIIVALALCTRLQLTRRENRSRKH